MFLSIHGFCEYVDNETKTTKAYLKTDIKCETSQIQKYGTVYHKQFLVEQMLLTWSDQATYFTSKWSISGAMKGYMLWMQKVEQSLNLARLWCHDST